jgi:hypothetical protein
MSKKRETGSKRFKSLPLSAKRPNKRKKRETGRKSLNPLLLTAMSTDFPKVIFQRSRTRSLNTPELRVAHEALTRWLNGEDKDHRNPHFRNSPESAERVLNLLATTKQLTRKITEDANRFNSLTDGRHSRDSSGTRRSWSVISTLQGLFNDYATVPFLAFQSPTKLWGVGHWPANLPGAAGSDMTEEELAAFSNGSYPLAQKTQSFRPYGEVMAAHGILELVRNNALERIRQCNCKLWFFAVRKRTVAHAPTCRKRLYDQTPEAIAKRKKRAKDNEPFTSGKIHLKKSPGATT